MGLWVVESPCEGIRDIPNILYIDSLLQSRLLAVYYLLISAAQLNTLLLRITTVSLCRPIH